MFETAIDPHTHQLVKVRLTSKNSSGLEKLKLYFEGEPIIVAKIKEAKVNTKKSIKVLTKYIPSTTIITVHKLTNRKDDDMDGVETNNQFKYILISVGWLAFAVQQGVVGYMLTTNVESPLAFIAGYISLFLSGFIIANHFLKAHRTK